MVRSRFLLGYDADYVSRLGLPWPADRVEDRGTVPRQGPPQGRGVQGRVPPRLPRLRRQIHRPAARSISPPGCRRRLRQPLRHHGLQVRGGHRRRIPQVQELWPAVSRLQALHVVAGRTHGACRRRDRFTTTMFLPRSGSSSRSRPCPTTIPTTSWPSAPARHPSSSGRPRRGPSRPTAPSAMAPRSPMACMRSQPWRKGLSSPPGPSPATA